MSQRTALLQRARRSPRHWPPPSRLSEENPLGERREGPPPKPAARAPDGPGHPTPRVPDRIERVGLPRREDLITVLLPVRNGGAHLRSQLDALARQRIDREWEVLVADNGSTDDSATLAAAYAERLPGLRVLDVSAAKGKAGAVNAAVPQARGARLVMIDADDEVAPDFLAAMARGLDEHCLVAARLDIETLNPSWLQRRRRPVQQSELSVGLRYRPFVVGAAIGVRTEAFEAVGGYDPAFRQQEDVDLSWRLQQAGHQPVLLADAVVRYRYRQGLTAIFRQERAYAHHEVLLYRRHRAYGVPRRRLRATFGAWARLLLAMMQVGSTSGRARAAGQAGAAAGRLTGSLTCLVWYL